MEFLKTLVSAEKLGGWTRSLVASSLPGLLTTLGLTAVAGPEFSTAMGVVVSTVVVGLWQHFVKS